MPTLQDTDDRLLSEIERQQKYLDRLPDNFEFPLFNSKQALESQRRNGYRHTAAAAREIVDNALEAGAKNIHVIFDRPRRLAKFQRQDSVSAVAFIDDGSGMLPKMAQYALSWGAGTHFDEPDFIGKFGFGLPNASINQTRRVEVYTKISAAAVISMTKLDADEAQPHGVQTIEPAVEKPLPDFVQRYIDNESIAFTHGTIVVWVLPDRLSYRTGGALREHLVEDFGVTYRYMLNRVTITVEGTDVVPVDPLFLTPKARYYLPPEKGGAVETFKRTVPVRYYRDKTTGALHLEKITDPEELNDPDVEVVAVGNIHVKIGRLPPGFALQARSDENPDANRRFEFRKPRRGMSFVRTGREIETLDAFPRSMRDIASGLGKWPLLQGYAYYWGVEVSFDAALDEVFGITNDKQTVRPIEDFWRLLAKEEIDRLVREENRWQAKQRTKVPKVDTPDQPTPAEQAATAADTASGQRPKVPENVRERVRQNLEEEAQREAEATGKPYAEVLAAIQDGAKRRPYKIQYVDDTRAPFFEPSWRAATQIVVTINRKHAFYETAYGELIKAADASLARQALDVLLITLARAELTADDPMTQLLYERQRESVWSPYLADALKFLDHKVRPGDDDTRDTEHGDVDDNTVTPEAAE